MKEANSKIVEKLHHIKEIYDVEKITIDALQVLIDSLNGDHIITQEESKAIIKRMKYDFNIKKYYTKNNLESKQWQIESLKTRNIQLNQIQNDKEEEIHK